MLMALRALRVAYYRLSRPVSAHRAPLAPHAEMAHPTQKPVVLCVDDEKIILDSLRDQLESWLGSDYELELAESAQEGLEIIEECARDHRPVAIVISDQIMPGMNGDEFLARVHTESPGTLKILLTGQTSLEAIQNAINRASLFRYIAKPWEATDLMVTVTEAARSFSQKQQIDFFNQSNQLLKQLNEATREISELTDLALLYSEFIKHAVRCTTVERGFLLLGEASAGGKLSVVATAAKEASLSTDLNAVLQADPEALREYCMDRIVAYAHNKLEPHCLATPLLGGQEYVGYVVLENAESQSEILDIQSDIVHMLCSHLVVNLDKARLLSRLEGRTTELHQEKERVEEVLSLLQEKNEDMTESIRYASRIQHALIPSVAGFQQYFPDSFFLYKPKDIVSGDFYWWAERTMGTLLLAAVDCTGHGVPGALMSVIAATLLNRSVENPYLRHPNEILRFTNQELRKVLTSSTGGVGDTSRLDGMDIALVQYSPEKKAIEFSGAMRPLLLGRGGHLQELPGTRASIGGAVLNGKEVAWELQTLPVEPGDVFYLFTDGFTDQFGGKDRRKFSRKRLTETLESVMHLPMEEQHLQLNLALDEWMGNLVQTDDILLIGVRIPG